MATLDTSSSSDEDLYDNFSKYKKAVQNKPKTTPPKLPKGTADDTRAWAPAEFTSSWAKLHNLEVYMR